MMHFTLAEILSYSIGLAAIIGLIRYKKIDRAYLPFILLLWTGVFNEVISTISIRQFKTNAINNNIYVLAESILILIFFRSMGMFRKHANLFWILLTFLTAIWITDNFYISHITQFSSYFRVVYSFVTVLISIHLINRVVLEDRGWLLKNAAFLIAMGFVSFFTCKALIEIFWIYGLNSSREFRLEVYRITAYINLAVNIIYAIAVLWMPRKREYTLL